MILRWGWGGGSDLQNHADVIYERSLRAEVFYFVLSRPAPSVGSDFRKKKKTLERKKPPAAGENLGFLPSDSRRCIQWSAFRNVFAAGKSRIY